MQLLQQLKGVDTDALQMEEAIALLAVAGMMQTQYEALGLENPVWLGDVSEKLEAEIKLRHRDEVKRQLREIENAEEGLKTAGEKRRELSEKKARLLKQLG